MQSGRFSASALRAKDFISSAERISQLKTELVVKNSNDQPKPDSMDKPVFQLIFQ
jgi:hypothetical protein